MEMYSLLGIVFSLLIAIPLAWKWQLGIKRVALAITLIGAIANLLVVFASRYFPIAIMMQIGLVGALTLLIAALILACRFYRDPERFPPDSRDLIVSPADGKVIYVRQSRSGMLPVSTKQGENYPLLELTKTSLQFSEAVVIGISMNFLDVHVNRTPIEGQVAFCRHFPGRFGSLRKNAMIFENERATTVLERPGLQVAVVQIASRLVRQIIVFVKEGQSLAVGQRMGAIRLGSQVDLVLPLRDDIQVMVREGDKVRAGESVIAVVDTSLSKRNSFGRDRFLDNTGSS